VNVTTTHPPTAHVYTVTAGSDGKWSVEVASSLSDTSTPLHISITGSMSDDSIEFDGILGEVLMCSGQVRAY
jgi:hypothetical protein